MHFSSIKERNRLISKGVSNIYLKVIIEKKWGILQFSKFKKLSSGHFLGSCNSCRYYWIFKLFVPT